MIGITLGFHKVSVTLFFMSVKNNKQQGIHEKGSGDVVSAVCLQRDR